MIELTDIRGVRIRFDTPPLRIVSLVPSLTETLVDLGCVDRIVGCTSFCLEIEGMRNTCAIGGTKDPEIDLIRSLNPDLVLASREENRREDVEGIERFSRVYVCEPRILEDVLDLLADLGGILDKAEGVQKWSGKIINNRNRLNRLRDKRKHLRFGYLVWWNPPIVAGCETYISNLLEEGPFENAFGDMRRYPKLEIEELLGRDLDTLFVSSEPYDFSNAIIAEIIEKAGGIQVEKIDGRMCGWYGTRTLRALEYLHDMSIRQ